MTVEDPTLLEDVAKGVGHIARGLGQAVDLHRHVADGPKRSTPLGRVIHIGEAIAAITALAVTAVELVEHGRGVRARRSGSTRGS